MPKKSQYYIWRSRIWEILEIGKPGDKLSNFADIFLIILILSNIIALVLETVDSIYEAHKYKFIIFEIISTFIFLIEYLCRVWVCVESKDYTGGPILARLKFAITWPAIIDLLAVTSGLLPMLYGDIDLRFLRAFRMLRILKFSRYFRVMGVLLDVLREEKQSLLAAMFLLSIAMLISSTGIYVFEKDAQPDKFGSIPEAMWWAVATLTTVGYGDVTPITALGKVFGSIITVVGIGVVALPSGILASGFSDHLRRRQKTYQEELSRALEDKIITSDERDKLKELAENMSLSPEQIALIENALTEDKEKK